MKEIRTYIHKGLVFETTLNKNQLQKLIEEEETFGEFRPLRFMNRNKGVDIKIYKR